jgi:RHS repeat-associated protein
MGQFASNVSWHRSGPLAGFTYGNNVVFSQLLNLRGLPSERSDRLGTQYRQRDTYSWDGNGNLTADNDLIGDSSQYRNASRWLQYDGLDRLTVADSAAQPPLQRSSPWSFSWSEGRFGYDALDNVRTFQMGYLDYRYQYIGHRLSTIQQGTDPTPLFGYGHNSRGQVTSRQFEGDSYTLSWDSAHRLTRSQNAAATKVEQYRYDAHGHRARTQRGSETVWQVYSRSGDLMFERSSGGSTLKYARLGGRLIGEIRAGGRLAIHTDVIGSVRQKTNAMGTVVDEDVRAPYGSVLVNGYYRNGPAFTGHMEDGGTGLTYMKARYYDPVSMRFLSPDPVYVDLGSGANFNRYWYANNNPYTYVDPDGRQSACPTGTRICYESRSPRAGASSFVGPPRTSENTTLRDNKDRSAIGAHRTGRTSDGERINVGQERSPEQGLVIGESGVRSNPMIRRCWRCSDGRSGEGGRYNVGALSPGESAGHTHTISNPDGYEIEQFPGPGDAGLVEVTGQENYVFTSRAIFAVGDSDYGYYARQIYGSVLGARDRAKLIKTIEAWNSTGGRSNGAGVICTSDGC